MEAIDILKKEHGLIRSFLDNLSMAVERLEDEQKPPAEFFEKAIRFARQFADSFHHFKEEEVIFRHLAQNQDGEIDAQIEALRYQHERGRNFISGISDALPGYTKGEEIKTSDVLENMAA